MKDPLYSKLILCALCPRSSERDWTQRDFLPPRRTAARRTSRPVPAPLYCKCSYVNIQSTCGTLRFTLGMCVVKGPRVAGSNLPSHCTGLYPVNPRLCADVFLLRSQTGPAHQKHRRGAGPNLPGPEARHRAPPSGTNWYLSGSESLDMIIFNRQLNTHILFLLPNRSGVSATSCAAFWIKQLPRGAGVHPAHKAATGKTNAPEAKREKRKLQAAVIQHSVGVMD